MGIASILPSRYGRLTFILKVAYRVFNRVSPNEVTISLYALLLKRNGISSPDESGTTFLFLKWHHISDETFSKILVA